MTLQEFKSLHDNDICSYFGVVYLKKKGNKFLRVFGPDFFLKEWSLNSINANDLKDYKICSPEQFFIVKLEK